MFKKIVLFLLFFAFNCSQCEEAQQYRSSSFHKLDNGVSVVFIDTTKSNSLLILLCVSAGSTDEFDKRGVSNLLSKIFLKKLNENASENSLQYGSESSSYAGYDQSVYYYFGKTENIEGFLKNFADIFSNFKVSDDELKGCKKNVEHSIISDNQLDMKKTRSEARKSLYVHSQYGFNIEGDLDSIHNITPEEVLKFKEKNYTNNRATIVIVGNIDKNKTLELIKKYFEKGGKISKIDRLREPHHHGATTKIKKYSSQVSVPVVEMYWRVPNYRNDKDKALALEVFINAFDEILRKKLMEDLDIAASISFCYSFWNYYYGDFCITLTPKNSDKLDLLETAVLSEIKYIVDNGITKEQAEMASKKLSDASDFMKRDLIDVVDIFSKRISSGNEFDLIKGHALLARKYKLESVNAQAKAIFKNDPSVISIILPSNERSTTTK